MRGLVLIIAPVFVAIWYCLCEPRTVPSAATPSLIAHAVAHRTDPSPHLQEHRTGSDLDPQLQRSLPGDTESIDPMPAIAPGVTEISTASSPAHTQRDLRTWAPRKTPAFSAQAPPPAGNSAAQKEDGVVVIHLPSGLRPPVALVDSADEVPADIAEAKAVIADEFTEDVIESVTGQSDDAPAVWEAAQRRADERLRLLFGKTHFEQASLRAGRTSQAPLARP